VPRVKLSPPINVRRKQKEKKTLTEERKSSKRWCQILTKVPQNFLILRFGFIICFVRKRGKKKNVTKAKEYFLFREKPINSIAGIINYQHRSLMNTKGKRKKKGGHCISSFSFSSRHSPMIHVRGVCVSAKKLEQQSPYKKKM